LDENDWLAANGSRGLEIDIPHRELRLGGEAIPIASRAFDILRLLVERSGNVLTKQNIIETFPSEAVLTDDELHAHISTIRKALGTSRTLLKTISGQGYQLLGSWTARDVLDPVEPQQSRSTKDSARTPSHVAFDKPGPEVAASSSQPTFRSGECEIDTAQRQVRIRGIPILIGSRAFDIMTVLAQTPTDIVTRDRLLERVWPAVTVGEKVIDVHISAIRKALGEHRTLLKTISGRGYRLVGTWTRQEGSEPKVGPPSAGFRSSTNLPEAVNTLVGRSASLEYLREACHAYRLITITGPGGVGKTALAMELARSLLTDFNGSIRLVELASLADPNLVPLAVIEGIGMQAGTGSVSAESVARLIGYNRLLLVLDNCEHLISAAADLAEVVLRLAPNAVILATSRETLRIRGERVYRVPPLDVPRPDSEAAEILGNSAVQLFISRSETSQAASLRQGQNLRLIARICRRLDGLPLAIEFAAARATSLGVSQVADSLDDRFAVLGTGRRAALARHRTLRAVLDWSYALLPEAERRLLHRAAIFSGGFAFDAACAVMHDISQAEVADSIVNLVERSIISLEHSILTGRWRLLETVRAYALDKLTSSGELRSVRRRHAQFFRSFFAGFDLKVELKGVGAELSAYTREVDNLRAALSWAFSVSGDTVLGITLAAAAVDFWMAVSMFDECRTWTSKALAELGGAGHDEQEMVLRSGLGQSLTIAEGMTSAALANLTRALSIAESRGSIGYQQRSLHGLWWCSLISLELRKALELGRRYAALSSSDIDPSAVPMANLTVGVSLTYLGAYREATGLLQQAIRDYPPAHRRRHTVLLGIDPPPSAYSHLAMCLLPRGLIDAAALAAEQSIEVAQQIGQPLALCLALARAAGLLLPEIGALDAAERHIALLIEHADRHALDTFRGLAVCAKGRVLLMRGDPASSVSALRSGLAQLEDTGYRLYQTIFRGYLAEALSEAGNLVEALTEIETALRYAEQTDYQMWIPELLRIHGSLARRLPDDPLSEQMLTRAITLANQQEALYWELRAALSLAEHWNMQGRRNEACTLLAPLYQRFTEGLASPILVRANSLLRGGEAVV
jgi:non-specific serine/threonine protein kinase